MNDLSEILKLCALGGVAGVLSGMFGIGGGLVIVPALVLIFGFDIKSAVGTSLFVILLPTGLLGVLEYHKNGQLKIPAGLMIALGVFVGAFFGAKLAGAVSAATMRRSYAVFLLLVAGYFLLVAPPITPKVIEPAQAAPVGEDGPGS